MDVPRLSGLQPEVKHGGPGDGDLDGRRLVVLGVDGPRRRTAGLDVLRLVLGDEGECGRAVQAPALQEVGPDVGLAANWANGPSLRMLSAWLLPGSLTGLRANHEATAKRQRAV